MADDIQKDRSPRCPRITLEDAIKTVKDLHEKIGKASVKVEAAIQALGFTTYNGAVAKILASLNQYGLIDRKIGDVSVTSLAIQILHPISEDQRKVALQKAALDSSVFVRIRKQFDDCDESVLANQLIQLKFTPEGAKRTAQIYKANVKFARLDLVDPEKLSVKVEASEESRSATQGKPRVRALEMNPNQSNKEKTQFSPIADDPFGIFREKKKTIAVPLGSGDTIQIPYPMTDEDFTLLLQTLKLWKKRIIAS